MVDVDAINTELVELNVYATLNDGGNTILLDDHFTKEDLIRILSIVGWDTEETGDRL